MGKVLKIGCGGVLLLAVILSIAGGNGRPIVADAPRENPGRIRRFPLATDSVIMHYPSREIRIYASRATSPSAFRGDTTYVWAFFTNAWVDNGQSSWSSEPVPVIADRNGRIDAALNFHWATNEEIPRDGWRAYVFIADSPEGVRIPTSERDKNPAYSVPGITRER